MRMLRVPLRVVFYQEEGRWIAHCLEFDLLGDGDSQESAIEVLVEAIQIQLEYSIEHNNPQNLFNPAESKYQHMFCAGRPIAQLELGIPNTEQVEFESIDAREFTEDKGNPLATY